MNDSRGSGATTVPTKNETRNKKHTKRTQGKQKLARNETSYTPPPRRRNPPPAEPTGKSTANAMFIFSPPQASDWDPLACQLSLNPNRTPAGPLIGAFSPTVPLART